MQQNLIKYLKYLLIKMCLKTFSRFKSVYISVFPFLLRNDLFLLGNSFSTLGRHLDGRKGLVVADPAEKDWMPDCECGSIISLFLLPNGTKGKMFTFPPRLRHV